MRNSRNLWGITCWCLVIEVLEAKSCLSGHCIQMQGQQEVGFCDSSWNFLCLKGFWGRWSSGEVIEQPELGFCDLVELLRDEVKKLAIQIETPRGVGPQGDNLDFPSRGPQRSPFSETIWNFRARRQQSGLLCWTRSLHASQFGDIILNFGAIKWLWWHTGN